MTKTQVYRPLTGVVRWGILMLGLLSLNGCDYWPAALQSQIVVLRTELNDALDDRQRLDQELRGLRTVQHSLEQKVEAKARENNALQQRLATLLKTPARHLSSEPKTQARVVIAASPTPTGHDL